MLTILPAISRALVALGWAGFFGAFFFVAKPKRPQGEQVARRAPASLAGIVLQGVGFTLVWMLERPFPRPGAPLTVVEIALDLTAPLLSIGSAWLGLAAVRALDKQWSYAARLVEGHELVTTGPYSVVRHPIYTAMLGILFATNFAFGHWLGLPIAGGAFLIGTMIRIRAEERLLREAFGAQFDDYARQVPALSAHPLDPQHV